MHEMGIILHLAKTLDEVTKEQKLVKIGRVTLEIGEVSGIMTDLFTDCWNYFKARHPILKESELTIETIPAITFCTNCKREYETVRYGRQCPFCGSGETYLVRGNECVIKEIEAATAEDLAAEEREKAEKK